MKRHFVWISVGWILIGLIGLLDLASICLAGDGKWVKKADMPTARGLSTSVVNGKIYAIGGLDANGVLSIVEEYDPVTDKWTKKADMPTARLGLSTSVVKGKIYAIGGWNGRQGRLSTIEEYDPATDTWTKKADMLNARTGLSTSAVDGKIYAFGGWFGLPVEEYDPVIDKWTKKADMPTERGGLATSVVNGKIYAIGGETAQFQMFSTVEEYDPVTDKWTKKADMPTARSGLSTSVVKGKIYAIGGWALQHFVEGRRLRGQSVEFSIIEEYDPMTDTWTKKGNMPTARSGLSTSAVDGKIYVIGGSAGGGKLSTVEEYDPAGLAEEGIENEGKLIISWGKIKFEYQRVSK